MLLEPEVAVIEFVGSEGEVVTGVMLEVLGVLGVADREVVRGS